MINFNNKHELQATSQTPSIKMRQAKHKQENWFRQNFDGHEMTKIRRKG